MTNCRLFVEPFVTINQTTSASGQAFVPIPLREYFSAGCLLCQWFVFEPTNPLGLTSTQRLEIPIVR
jgi:hypothetical protein